MTLKKTAHINKADAAQKHLGDTAHALTHEYDAEAVAVIVFRIADGDGIRAAYRLGCHVDDDNTELCKLIAQAMRQGCANMSKLLRERFVDGTAQRGESREVTTIDADDPIDGAPKRDDREVH